MNTIVWLLVSALQMAQPAPAAGFPHQVHTRFFPLCEGCHSGVATGVAAKVFPAAQECASCHDGVRRARVEWQTHNARATNLRFSHAAHTKAAKQKGKPVCQACHKADADVAAVRMKVGTAQPRNCMTCHAAPEETHLTALTKCAQCHVPLTRAKQLQTADIAGFPRPAWHNTGTFVSDHGRGDAMKNGVCTVCHARDTCERCHANGDQLPQIKSLERDARVAKLEIGKPPIYFAPASHTASTWATTHGLFARAQPATCSNCHMRSSCNDCHQAGSIARPIIAQLPVTPARMTGRVSVTHVSRRVHGPNMVKQHGIAAATDRAQCTQCHAQQQCASCHAGAQSRAFHLPNYSERHAPDVFAGSGQCQSCHNAETFCRACHAGSGIAAGSKMNAAFHNGQPMWVLAHGQAARLGLQACAACHRQNDCVRCHSASGGWGVNPHRAGFDGGRTASRSPATCRLCHVGNPSKGN